MFGTDIAFASTCLRASYAMSSTELAYCAVSAYAHAVRRAVLSWRMVRTGQVRLYREEVLPMLGRC
eukprot:2601107-Rhodomonas_salina.1